jgi:hypothetical protein
MFKKFKRSYEIQTLKSFDEILTILNDRTERQRNNKLTLLWETINYKKLDIKDNIIKIERNPNPFNPFKGHGVITFEFMTNRDGTKIKCTSDPLLSIIWGSFIFLTFCLVGFTSIVLLTIPKIYFSTILFVLVAGIVFYGFLYLSISFNSYNLESYSKTILYDLGLLFPDEDKNNA